MPPSWICFSYHFPKAMPFVKQVYHFFDPESIEETPINNYIDEISRNS